MIVPCIKEIISIKVFTTSIPRNKTSLFCVFFYQYYKKNIYIKDGIKLASLKSMFQYKSNDTNFTYYKQDLVPLFTRLKFALKYVCTIFLETEVVLASILMTCVILYYY
jgi:hypothetical protein